MMDAPQGLATLLAWEIAANTDADLLEL